MNKVWLAPAGLAAAALIAVGCGSSGGSTGSGGSPAAPASGNMVSTAKISGATVLTNSRGFALYWFGPDTSTKSNCNGSCASFWPPLKGPVTAMHVKGTFGTIKRSDGRFGGTYSFNYDVEHDTWLQRRFVAYYNSQCCGIQFDYQTQDITHLGIANTPSNRHFGIAFTLAGIGSFANPMGSPTW